ncbi:response regulator [Curvibacter sp. HBC28]|uniref:Response regulator n=1 Tax=Curvibacter microcysteis TaxID=3026419 RepID=A0ABT5MHG2_9BURK|nr:response regulator [Curvibacter sp. HBC28]MDD0815983.1 response regulator [Curvibacter sp. HBC28]
MAKTILVVDDSATMTLSLKSSLELNGFKVDSAPDGFAALEKLKRGLKPDLIITDINMPRMDGMELIRQVKALPGMRFTPILTLTTESDSRKRDECKKLGATGWLVKPVSGPDLVKIVKQVVIGV